MVKTIMIEGMMCPHCEGRVLEALKATAGVCEVKVSHKEGCASVVVDEGVSDEILTSAVEGAGYKVTGIK